MKEIYKIANKIRKTLFSLKIQTKGKIKYRNLTAFLEMNNSEEEPKRPKYKFSNIPVIDVLGSGPYFGPRSCTDPFCYILFLMFSFYFLGVSSVALFMGDPDLIGAPYDPNHRACGVDSEAADYPYIYFTTPSVDSTGNYLYRTVCLKECPVNIGSNVYAETLECLTNKLVENCKFKAQPANESFLFYNTVPYLGKVCLPVATMYFTAVENYIDGGWVTNTIVDIKHSFFMICAGISSTLLLALILLKCLQWCSKAMINGLLLLYFIILFLFGGAFIYKGFYTEEIDSSLLYQSPEDLLNSATVSSEALLAYIIIGSLLILLALSTSIYLCFHRNYAKIMSDIVNATFEFLSQNNILILFALFLYIVLTFLIMSAIAIALFIFSIGFVDETLDYTLYYPFNQFQNNPFFYYNLWGLLAFMMWSGYVCLGVYQFVIMGTASNWYFRDLHPDPEARRKGMKKKSIDIAYNSRLISRYYIKTGLTSNFGSIVLGSLMILLFGWINTILTFLKEKLQITYKRSMNEKSCFNSFYKCFEYFFNFIRVNTETAYIMISYKGDPFLTSSFLVSQIIDEYYEIFSEISTLTTLLSTGLNLICILIPSVIFYYVFEYVSWYETYLSSSIHPTVAIGLLSLINASVFNTLFSSIVDTLVICYSVEKETLKYDRKLLHFNKDPEYQTIPKEPELENKAFLGRLLEGFADKFKKMPTELSAIDSTVKSPTEIPKKRLPKKTCIIKPDPKPEQNSRIIGNNSNANSRISNQANRRMPMNNVFVEQFSLPKVNDIIRASSPIKYVWAVEEKQPPTASKKRLEQQRSPFNESPFSEVIWNTKEKGFNFQKDVGLNVLNIDLKLDENA